MAAAWYTLIVGILITLDGIIFLIFPLEDFLFPNWYLGIILITGVTGIILGIVSVSKKSRPSREIDSPKDSTEEETTE
jgi:uncharacterized membrane protein HdeD (DUF308 family)